MAVSNGNVNAHGFYGGAFPSDVAQAKGQKDELARLCPTCKLKQESVLISNFPTTVPPIVQTAIRADPKLNWFFPTFDALNLYVVPAVTQAGAADRVQSTSHNAIAANLKYVLKGQVQTASIGENTTWWAYATADNLARLMVGQAGDPRREDPAADLRQEGDRGGRRSVGRRRPGRPVRERALPREVRRPVGDRLGRRRSTTDPDGAVKPR